jgi:hypothetical protein
MTSSGEISLALQRPERARVELGRERPRAIDAARVALEDLRRGGPRHRQEASTAEQWLAQHAGDR